MPSPDAPEATPPARPGLRRELRRLVELRPSPRRWPVALGAALSLVLPALAFTLAGQATLGLVASNGAFLALYLADRPAAHRARRLPLVAAGLFASAVLAASVAQIPGAPAILVGLVALAAALLTLGLRVGPPGAVFFAMVAGLIGSLLAPPSAGGLGLAAPAVLASLAIGLVVAYLLAIAPLLLPSVRAASRTAGPAAALRFELGPEARIVLVRVGVAVVLATLVSIVLGVHRGYWVVVTVIAILQSGVLRRLTTVRAAHRLLGTVLGAGLFVAVAFAAPSGIALVLALGVLQAIIELLVVRHYGLALVFITPLVLLIAARQPGVSPSGVAGERILDTAIGAGIALLVLVVEFALERRLPAPGRPARTGDS